MKGIIIFFISMAIYGGGIIVLGFIAGHPIIGIALALFVVASLYGVSVASQLAGAETALRNPPPPGETQVTLKIYDREIPISKKFLFSPPAPDGQTHNFTINKKRGRTIGVLSSAELTRGSTVDDILPFLREAKEAHDKRDGSFTKLCKQKGYPESTVRDWLSRYANKI